MFLAEIAGPKTMYKVQYSVRPNNVSAGVSLHYVPDNQMPVPGYLGWAVISYDAKL